MNGTDLARAKMNRDLSQNVLYADLILFDPDRIQDNATFEQPNRLSDGIHSVWVNGKQVLADGVLTEHLPGKIILREVN